MALRSPVSRLVAVLAVAIGTLLAVPATAQAAVPLSGGMGVSFGGERSCTVGATGYDSAGRAIALSAGHCAVAIGEPVFLDGNPRAGVLGRVVAINHDLDYSVIELDRSRATPVGQQGVAGTAPVPPAGAEVCKVGRSTGFSCGPNWQFADGWFWAQTCAGYGDSGGPVTAGDRLVGFISGGGIPPAGEPVASLAYVLPSCLHPVMTGISLPAVSISFDRVMEDINHRGLPGAGFRLA